jgi:hypothetical protein
MAGSYSHVTHGFGLIENLGDASEALHEMLWLIERGIGRKEAKRLLASEYYPMARGEQPKDEHFKLADELQEK